MPSPTHGHLSVGEVLPSMLPCASLYEDPWERLRKMRKLVPNIPFQMLLRGANGVAYSSLPDNAIFHFVEQAKKNGVDIFRVFDALNDVEQLEVGIKAVLKAGGVAEGTVCYS
jgi:pyruvate carboxylase